ncbi:MAG TPA: phosphorylase [Xanthobacteraceae bacterium]|nr:phosphorylase [Xanthobacteraceae bacterium]
MFLVITGLAQESRIAAGPGVSNVVCSGSDPKRLRNQLSGLDPSGLRAVISFGIAGGLHPALEPGDVVVATAVIAEKGTWKVPGAVVSAMAERVGASGISVSRGALVGVEEPVLLPSTKARMHEATDAIAVDMESHIGAAYAADNQLPFAAIRVISDPAVRALPPLAKKALKPDGRVDFAAVFSGLARAPSEITTLIRAGGDAGRAFAGLRRCRRFLDFGLCFGLADL